jgi:hypothetical protein
LCSSLPPLQRARLQVNWTEPFPKFSVSFWLVACLLLRSIVPSASHVSHGFVRSRSAFFFFFFFFFLVIFSPMPYLLFSCPVYVCITDRIPSDS